MKPLPKFTAVIHVETTRLAISQTAIAYGSGAQGVFLIDHARHHADLLATYQEVRREFPSAFIGLNFLDLDAAPAAGQMPEDADALWVDSPGDSTGNSLPLDLVLYPDRPCAQQLPAGTRVWGKERGWRAFVGVQFKYQPQRRNDTEAAEIAAALYPGAQDVITTSGPATGEPPHINKLFTMRQGLPPGRMLALASGVDLDNVGVYAPFVDCFLVATGISRSFHRLEPGKVRDLANALNLP